jgi:hypothetical protein
VNRPLAAILGLVLIAAAPAALAQPAPTTPQPPGKSINLQGGDQYAFTHNQYIRQFYDLSVATLRSQGHVDVDAYEQKSFAIFREFGVATGMGAEHMQDHLKLIPRQVVQIARDDPKVLDSFDSFIEALVGPQ